MHMTKVRSIQEILGNHMNSEDRILLENSGDKEDSVQESVNMECNNDYDEEMEEDFDEAVAKDLANVDLDADFFDSLSCTVIAGMRAIENKPEVKVIRFSSDPNPPRSEKNYKKLTKQSTNVYSQSTEQDEVNLHVCPLCPTSVRNYKALKFHFVKFHSCNYEPVDKYICTSCVDRIVFDSLHNLRLHMEEDHDIVQKTRKRKRRKEARAIKISL